jgi:hypothetical protein
MAAPDIVSLVTVKGLDPKSKMLSMGLLPHARLI